jgi:hypothetical protein
LLFLLETISLVFLDRDAARRASFAYSSCGRPSGDQAKRLVRVDHPAEGLQKDRERSIVLGIVTMRLRQQP